MEFTAEFIEANGLSEEQVTALNSHVQTELVPNLKKEYDGLANKNSEGILDGAAKYAKDLFKVDIDRGQGEKWGDYLQRISDNSFNVKKSELEAKEAEIQEKLKNFKGGDEYKAQLETLRVEKDNLLKQVAELEPLKGLDEKYNGATQELSKLKREVAYGSVKPTFPETVNKFEADAKWNAFKSGIEEKYNLELVDGKAFAIDKENIHKRYELSTLVSQDESISELLKGRQQSGTGANPAEFKSVEGIPFKIPKDATNEELSALVREHVLKEVGSLTDSKYASKFQELYLKARNAK